MLLRSCLILPSVRQPLMVAAGAAIPPSMIELCARVFASQPSEPGGRPTDEPTIVSALRGLRLLRHPVPTALEAFLYEPVVCLILQGRKQTTFGDHTFDVGAGECLLVSHDLPVVSRITEAPYLTLLLDIELELLRSFDDELSAQAHGDGAARALEVYAAPPALLDALGRYLALAQSPSDAKILGPMIAREIHYRLLTAPFGGMLRSLFRADSHASAVARAIAHLRRHYREPLSVADLARRAGMSVSSFHRRFKEVTSSSPLSYQKDLRLLEARRLLRTRSMPVSTVAYEVGYASPSQFSREYARRFGQPPKLDARLTASAAR